MDELGKRGYNISQLPFSIRIVAESLLRNLDGVEVKSEDLDNIASWSGANPADTDLPFKISRVLMQDFTGVPAVVDLAALREYAKRHGRNPEVISPLLPVDLVIDHSVQVDEFRNEDALAVNQKNEIARNAERYALLKWASSAFDNFRVVPPSGGICHQVNLEHLATCVSTAQINGKMFAYPDTLVGTDSHTTMIGGLGIVGFGVGGIEAEAALLGQPVALANPMVVGVHLTGRLKSGVTAMDVSLTLTKILRDSNVVGKFVEFFGEGVKVLSLPDRATISNMCPEYGATVSIFPVDEETLHYMRNTGRSDSQIELIREYYRAQHMFPVDYSKVTYSSVIELDLGEVEPAVSGPSQPKQQVKLSAIGHTFKDNFLKIEQKQGANHAPAQTDYTRWGTESEAEAGEIEELAAHRTVNSAEIVLEDGHQTVLSDGDIVIAAITSCTNTSNPAAMVGAGILAKKALEHGLSVNGKIKTSLAPGSRVVMNYLKAAQLDRPLEELGFYLVGYGCTTCIGNSGPLPRSVSDAIQERQLITASVLSGNRNFEARIHTEVRANYLMSPQLVVAFAIAGTVLRDLTTEPVGINSNGEAVYLSEIWPTEQEISDTIKKAINTQMFNNEYNAIYQINSYWTGLRINSDPSFEWDANSTYIRLPPFFDSQHMQTSTALSNARVLAAFGDSITTDHISPAGAISADSPAGRYLVGHNVQPLDFNTYGARRGNHEVMMRGTFANSRIKNFMMEGKEGGNTVHYPDNKQMTIYDAAMAYQKEGVPLIVIAGSEYGAGSSRDWAAKGPMLLGVRAVIAKSFERIHRSNLIGMGILPLQFENGQDASTLDIDYSMPISIAADPEAGRAVPANNHTHAAEHSIMPKQEIILRYYKKSNKQQAAAKLISRLDTQLEVNYYTAGGVLNYVLNRIIK